MTYLPQNSCGCNSTTSSPCGATEGCLSSTIIYNGPILPASGVKPCDSLNVTLSKIDEVLSLLLSQQRINTNAINAITLQIIDINSQITIINNTCCP